jgi:hypothetical protein
VFPPRLWGGRNPTLTSLYTYTYAIFLNHCIRTPPGFGQGVTPII